VHKTPRLWLAGGEAVAAFGDSPHNPHHVVWTDADTSAVAQPENNTGRDASISVSIRSPGVW
jgi:hypothetical protein